MPSLLVLSFSRIEQDARVRRQLALFAPSRTVVSAGFGAPPPESAQHIEIPVPAARGWRRKARFGVEAVLLRLRAYRVLYATDPTVRATRRALRGVSADAVIVNDIFPLPLVLDMFPPDRVHADLHEFYPGLHDDNPRWNALRRPYLEWLVRRFAPRATSVTTVGSGVADAYRAYGLTAQVVHNAPAYQSFRVGEVGSTIRIVHAGGAMPGRRLERLIEAVASSTADVTLTMFLTANDPSYLKRLKEMAGAAGDRVTVLDAVPHDELLATLNQYDVGVHVLPPIVTNQALAMPNKLFDYAQARLALLTGPTPGMAAVVRENGIGAVTDGFEVEDIRRAIDALTADRVATWKSNADAAARVLSAESQLPVWSAALESIEGSGSRR